MTKRISTAAYLAGVTTIAVSLPMMASARTSGTDMMEETAARDTTKSDCVQMENIKEAVVRS